MDAFIQQATASTDDQAPQQDSCNGGIFDFDDLDMADNPYKTSDSSVGEESDGNLEEETSDNLADNNDSAEDCGTGFLATSQNHLTANAPARHKRISKARAWFEIRRFFDAEPQQHYNSTDKDEWKTYYAKELILQTVCEKLQGDGFVVLDALLAPEIFQSLVQNLLLDAPEQAHALKDHIPDKSWKTNGALMSGGQACCKDSAIVPLDLIGGDDFSTHDSVLVDSCLLSLAHDRQTSTSLRPRAKQQLFSFMKTFFHEVARNSIWQSEVPKDQKIPVQMCFGNMPRPKSALTAPPQLLSIKMD